MFLHTEYSLTLYLTIKPLWHLWTSELRLCRPRSKFWGDLTRLFLRESLTPCLSLSLWFRTTYPQSFAGISLRVETQVRYAMIDDGAELIMLVLPAGAAGCCCLLLVPCQVCYGSCRVSFRFLIVYGYALHLTFKNKLILGKLIACPWDWSRDPWHLRKWLIHWTIVTRQLRELYKWYNNHFQAKNYFSFLFALISVTICCFESRIFMHTNRLPHTFCIMFNPKFNFPFTLWVHFDISFHAEINKYIFTFIYLAFSMYKSGLTKSISFGYGVCGICLNISDYM